jgi:hypothetical protein
VVAALLIGALVLRLLYLATPRLDSDQAVFGLMARHMLHGECPIFQWGYSYMGTLESMTAAPLMLVFGANRFALNLAPMLYSLLFAYACFLIGRHLGGRGAGLWALALGSFPPTYLVWTCVTARGAYSETLALGTLASYFALRALEAEGGREEKRLLAIVGALLGLAFWTHMITVFWGAAILLLWLVERPSLIWRAIRFAAIPFFIASLPFWFETLRTHFATLIVAAPPAWSLGKKLGALFQYRLAIILGVYLDGADKGALPYVSWGLAVVQLAGLAFLFKLAAGHGTVRQRQGARLLLFFAVATFGIYLSTSFSGAGTQRYLVPLYTLLVVSPALLVSAVEERSRPGAMALGLALIAVQTLPTLSSVTLFDAERLRVYRAERENDQRLFELLDRLKIDAVYADSYWDGPRLTFDSSERIIFANPFEDRRPEYLRFVDGAERVAFLFHTPVPAFEGALRLAGSRFETARLVQPGAIPYVLYHSFSPRPAGGADIPVVAARANRDTEDASLAMDLDAATRWSTLAPQRRGMWYEIDLGEPKEVAEVLLWPRFAADAPRGLRIDVSNDQSHWVKVAEARSYWGPLGWFQNRPVPMLDGWVVARFEPISCRWVRLTLLEGDEKFNWSITELKVREPGRDPSPAPPRPPASFARLFTDPVLAGRLPGSISRTAGQEIPHFADLHDAGRIAAQDEVLLPAANAPDAERAANELGLRIARNESLEGYRLLSGFGRDFDAFSRRRLRSWTLDEEKQTLRIDLEEVVDLAGVALAHGSAVMNFPRGVVARTSLDGQSWSSPAPLVPRAPELFWSYEGIVGASFQERLFLFSAVRGARFVELSASPPRPSFPWVVERLAILQPAATAK